MRERLEGGEGGWRECYNNNVVAVDAKQIKKQHHTQVPVSLSLSIAHLLAAMNTMTATIMVPQMAALAAIVILSMLEVCEDTVRTSRHC